MSDAERGIEGRCHCGAVRISVPQAPSELTECRCTLCRRYGGLWAYYPTEEVSISGPTQTYSWGRKRIAYHLCCGCGCVMAWRSLGDYPECGVNARMLEDLDVFAIPLVVEDDASV